MIFSPCLNLFKIIPFTFKKARSFYNLPLTWDHLACCEQAQKDIMITSIKKNCSFPQLF